MITISPIPRAGLLVVHHPTDAGKVRQWTGTGAPQWVELATATFAECAVTLEQIGTTGIYQTTLDLPDDATYPILLYGTDATAFSDQVIGTLTWVPEAATAAQAAAIKAKTDNLPDEPASKDDVQVTVQPTTLDSTAVDAIRDGLATSEQVSQITDKLPSSDYLAGSDSEDGAVTAEVGELEAKQDQLIALFQSGLPDVGPGQQRGARRVVKGDTYSSTGRQLLITKHKNADWPTDLSEWTWAFTASKHPDNENDGDALAGSVDVVTATGDSRGLRINHTKAQTLAAAVGRHLYAVRGTNDEDDSLVWTVELGVVDVEEAATE